MMAERSWTWAIFMWCNITSEEEEPYCHLKRMDASLISCIGLWTCTAVSCFLSEGKTSEPSKLLVVSTRCSITSIDFSKGETCCISKSIAGAIWVRSYMGHNVKILVFTVPVQSCLCCAEMPFRGLYRNGLCEALMGKLKVGICFMYTWPWRF